MSKKTKKIIIWFRKIVYRIWVHQRKNILHLRIFPLLFFKCRQPRYFLRKSATVTLLLQSEYCLILLMVLLMDDYGTLTAKECPVKLTFVSLIYDGANPPVFSNSNYQILFSVYIQRSQRPIFQFVCFPKSLASLTSIHCSIRENFESKTSNLWSFKLIGFSKMRLAHCNY